MKTRWKWAAGFVVLLVAGGSWVEHSHSKTSRLSSFLAAAYNGKADVVDRLLKEGENVDAQDPAYGGTALIYAAQQGNTEIVRLLLDKGANIEAKTRRDQTALMQAAVEGHADTVKLLLERGAKLDEKHRASVLTAISNNYPDITQMLQAGQDKPQGKTP